ncbi:MAG: hypothetical protein JJ901_10490 [Erythrobacter sp.]|nr:hypothetical protein [Erythrobacter sp.]
MTNDVQRINRLVYGGASKPPANIEWE